MSDDLVKRLKDWRRAMYGTGWVHLADSMEAVADRIEELEAKLSESEALLAKAVKLIELAIELGRWDLNPSFCDELITFTTELTGGKDE